MTNNKKEAEAQRLRPKSISETAKERKAKALYRAHLRDFWRGVTKPIPADLHGTSQEQER